MKKIFDSLYPAFEHERERLGLRTRGKQRQESSTNSIFQTSLLFATSLFFLGFGKLLTEQKAEMKEVLGDHPLCGIPTGGKVKKFAKQNQKHKSVSLHKYFRRSVTLTVRFGLILILKHRAQSYPVWNA